MDAIKKKITLLKEDNEQFQEQIESLQGQFHHSFLVTTVSSLLMTHRWLSKSIVGESNDKAELKKEREERESFEDEATMKIKKLEHDNETLEAEIDAVKAEECDI